jgi:hypothetical protein
MSLLHPGPTEQQDGVAGCLCAVQTLERPVEPQILEMDARHYVHPQQIGQLCHRGATKSDAFEKTR